MWTRWRLWLASILRRREFDRVIDAELRFHLQARVEHLQREGVPHAEAERQARLEIGAPERYKDELRDMRRGAWVEQLGQDLRYGARVLLGRPGFTVAATVTLALGVGATATVFSLLDVVLLRSLPVRDPHELAHIYTSCRAGDVYCSSSYPEYLDYRSQSRTFADMAAFQPMEVSVSGDFGSWVGTALLVSTNYFSLLGVAPLAGQLISPAWNVAADPPVVLAHDTWVTHFGGDSSIIGRRLRLSGGSFRIVGVAPSWFNGTRLEMRPDLWMPIENISLLPVGASDPGSDVSKWQRHACQSRQTLDFRHDRPPAAGRDNPASPGRHARDLGRTSAIRCRPRAKIRHRRGRHTRGASADGCPRHQEVRGAADGRRRRHAADRVRQRCWPAPRPWRGEDVRSSSFAARWARVVPGSFVSC